ncbi:DUF4097 family beta strand repeat-containing protein [Tellurirhabdus rosea]|uniref:DUF4097 family beta strand repeat-containing protein n=1 Tax=Tellurirhabdus rosea TaxID=2674997 RepID=UPI00225053A2|nr:DUF4097 family beta strand repeat-containing protein [Tellurirhabdus rosea]
MKSIVTAIALMLLTSLTPLVAQNESKEQLVVSLTDPGKPGSLEVGLVNGFIHVVGSNSREVVIEASSTPRNSNRNDDRATASGGMRRIPSGNSLEISAEERDNNIRIQTSSHARPVNLTIRVPQRFSLKISTVNNGDISVENVSGTLEVKNVNGPIELNNIGGSAVANTVNGHLTATFREVDSKAPMAFSTLNGRIDVSLPASVKANLKMKSDQGEIFSDFDVDIDKSQPKATRSSQSGMYRVSVDDWVNGRINGGGPEMMVKSMMGNIYIRKAK